MCCSSNGSLSRRRVPSRCTRRAASRRGCTSSTRSMSVPTSPRTVRTNLVVCQNSTGAKAEWRWLTFSKSKSSARLRAARMRPMQPHLWQFLALNFAGWVNRSQQDVIEYLKEENRVLREQLGARRLRFTDDQRRRLARTREGQTHSLEHLCESSLGSYSSNGFLHRGSAHRPWINSIFRAFCRRPRDPSHRDRGHRASALRGLDEANRAKLDGRDRWVSSHHAISNPR